MFLILLVPCALLVWLSVGRSKERSVDHAAGGLVGLICMLSILVSVYHHFYDGIILVVPIVGMLLANQTRWKNLRPSERAILLLLLLVPFVNYLSSKAIINLLNIEGTSFTAVTSINALCLTLALIYACYLAFRESQKEPAVNALTNSG